MKKILELTNYSAGICGVWQRVKQEAEIFFKEGHDVLIFSSNKVKGSNEIASSQDSIEKINIQRFSAKQLGGESFMNWDFEKEGLDFCPEIIIAHSYRHPHTSKAIKLAEKIRASGKNCKVLLVTHAPFDRSDSRSFFSKLTVWFYDHFIGQKILSKFDKVIAITKWEYPYLEKLGLNKEKINYIPNAIPNEFFSKNKISPEKHKILFLGRISPIKSIETLIEAMSKISSKDIGLDLVGPAEEKYLNELKQLISSLNLNRRVNFIGPIFDLKEKIEKIDSCKIFVLPSKSEGLPQSLIEAMARGKIVIASDNLASKDLIKDGKNGYLFKIGDSTELAEKINFVLKNKVNVSKNAKEYAKIFSVKNMFVAYSKLFNSRI